MKKLKFQEISFLSYSQKKARRINLESDRILIQGGTDTGKSCIAKSLYAILGASIKSVPETWEENRVVTLLKFSIDNVSFKALHIGRDFYVFNPDGTQRGIFQTTEAFAHQIFSLFDIHLPKYELNGIKQTLYSDYLFMPFYVDQDDGWSKPWSSFSKCGSPLLRADTFLLHTGVVPEDYFIYKLQFNDASQALEKIKHEQAANKRMCASMKKKMEGFKISMSERDFDSEMNSFICKISELKIAERDILVQLKELYNKKSYITFSIEQLHNNIKEIDKDFNYSLQQEEIITCPMCGSQVKNDFTGRFSMRDDIIKCKDMIIQNENELKDINSKIKNTEKSNQVVKNKLIEIAQLMQTKKDELSLEDYLNSKLEIYFDEIIKDETYRLKKESQEIINQITVLKAKIDDVSKKKRKKVVEEDFGRIVRKNLSMMNVGLNIDKQIPLSTNIAMTGTKVPRTIVAYTYAFIEIMCKYGGPVLCPVVIDEMRQRGLRDKDEDAMFDFLLENKPKGVQLIISTSSERIINDKDIKIIHLDTPNGLLNEDEYKDVSDEVENLLYSNFSLRNDF